MRAEGAALAGAGDLSGAAEAFNQADGRVPNHPGLILLRARVAALSGDPDGAMRQLARYARAGLTLDLAGDRHFGPYAADPGFSAVAGQLDENAVPVGANRLEVVAAFPGRLLIESAVHDAARGRWLVASVHHRTIFQTAPDGGLAAFLDEGADVLGVLGLALDAPRGVLWAATAGLPPALGLEEARRGTAELLAVDPVTGAVTARFASPAEGEHAFGDLVLTPDGTLYVSDSLSGEVLRLSPGARALQILVPAGVLGSPQGLAPTPDGAGLIVADYSSGLHRITLEDGTVRRLPAPEDAVLIGVDGLALVDRRILALQNGTAPHRVLALTLDDGFTRITHVEVLAAGLPELAEPTTGVVHDGDLVFISRSQWADFDADGAPRPGEPPPALLMRIATQPEDRP